MDGAGSPDRKLPLQHRQKLNPNPKFIVTAGAYFVYHINSNVHVSLIYAFIECPQSVEQGIRLRSERKKQ